MSTTAFPPSSCKWQTPLLVLGGLLVVVFILQLIDHLVVRPAFLQLEHREAIEDNNRVKAALVQEFQSLSDITLDWANWDDAYAFVEHPTQAFIDSSCPDSVELSKETRIDLMAFIHRNGRIIYRSVYNTTTQQVTDLPFLRTNNPTVQSLLHSVLNNTHPRKGIIHTDQGYLLLVAAGIHPSDRGGAPRGLLLMGRFLHRDSLTKLSRQTRVNFTLLPVESLSGNRLQLFNQLQQFPRESRPSMQDAGIYQLIDNIEGQPIALLHTEVRGEITALGRHMGRILVAVLGAISLVLLIWLSIYRQRMQMAHLDLQSSEDRYRQLFEAESDAIFLINNNTGQILEANRAATQLYQYQREELLQCMEGDLSAEPENARWLVAEPVQADSEEQVISIPLRLHRKKDGTIFPVEITGRFFRHRGNSFFITAIRDISDRQRMEKEQAELELLNRQLHKEESLGRMAGAIAHHFNNQLMIVTGFLQMAIDQEIPQEVKADMNKALNAARKATTISTLMQSYVGIPRCHRKAGDLAAVCQRFLPMLSPLLPESIQFNTDLPKPGPIISLNPEQLQQILTNLLTNSIEALEHQPPGRLGVINLRVYTVNNIQPDEHSRFPVNWMPEDRPYACLEVSDNGCGITPEAMDTLFDPFYTTKFTGRGLGLAVALGLTKVHQGAIVVDSTPELGSTFRVFLPLLG